MSVEGFGHIKVFGTNAGKHLADAICKELSIEPGQARVARFKDGEVDVQLLENVRRHDIYIVAPTPPPAENLFEAIALADAARLSSAGRVTMVIPYFGYGRADRKDAPRKPIGARIAFRMLEIAYPDRFLILDIHAEQTLACIERAVTDHLYGSSVAVPFLRPLLEGKDYIVASPDRGGGARAAKYASLFGHNDFVFFSKSRSKPGEVDENSIQIIGDVKGKLVVLVDDMIDSGGTILADARAAMAAGASEVWAFGTHGLFSQDALSKIEKSPITRVFTTDSIYHDPNEVAAHTGKLTIISVAPLLANAISRTHEGESLSAILAGF